MTDKAKANISAADPQKTFKRAKVYLKSKTTYLHSRITVNDLCSIMGNLSVGDDLFVTHWQTAANALTCLNYWPAESFHVTSHPGKYLLMERAA